MRLRRIEYLKKAFVPLFLLVFVNAATTSSDTDAAHGKCFGKLFEALRKGGYSGGLDCRNLDLQIKDLGRIQQEGHYLEIFSLVYYTKGEGVASHGGQRILFLQDGVTYVGQFRLPDISDARIAGTQVRIPADPRYGDHIELGAGIPPSAYIGGEVIEFYK